MCLRFYWHNTIRSQEVGSQWLNLRTGKKIERKRKRKTYKGKREEAFTFYRVVVGIHKLCLLSCLTFYKYQNLTCPIHVKLCHAKIVPAVPKIQSISGFVFFIELKCFLAA